MSHKLKIPIILVVLALLAYAAFAFNLPYGEKIDDFETCAAAGNPIMESYPRQCKDNEGNTYIESIPAISNEMIKITSPAAGATVSSPINVAGEARGSWYFEASFPVQIIADDGTVLATSPIQAQGEWMTTEFVPFSTQISFDPGIYTSGVVRFNKDNPSGLAENDAYVDVPVSFKSGAGTTTAKACKPTGCSGQICSDEDIASTCEFRSEYACYRTAVCERQATGVCGWTETPALKSCLLNPPQQ